MRTVSRVAALGVLTLLAATSALGQRPRVTIESGILEGVIDAASGVAVFNGVPFAAPPVGTLRWRPPAPVARWKGARDAASLGKNCMQVQTYADIQPFEAGVSEDCLYLNVWTAKPSAAERRPVMVWIHGGGFRAGFGGEERHNGGPLARKGAVVVTLNYRMSAMGFLAHPALAGESSHRSSGNYALLDQIEALRWVKRNIARFGGDPARVTIFGESAGGASVGALLVSPLAKGLFHRAILESGVGFFSTRRDSAEAAGLRFAAEFGLTGTDTKVLDSLRALSADTVLAVSLSPKHARLGARPVIDGWVIPLQPDSALAAGRANIVPVIVGSTGDEGDGTGAVSRALARLISSRGAPAYLYLYTRVAEDSVNRKRGAYHSSEITFVFGRHTPIEPSAGHAAYDSTLAETMSDYWLAFAATGDPNGAPSKGRWPVWPKYDSATDALIELGERTGARSGIKRAVYDSVDATARKSGAVRP